MPEDDPEVLGNMGAAIAVMDAPDGIAVPVPLPQVFITYYYYLSHIKC